MVVVGVKKRMIFQSGGRFSSSNSRDAFVLLDLNLKIVRVNHIAESLLGYSQEELSGKSISILFSVDYYESFHSILNCVFLGKSYPMLNVKCKGKKGEDTTFSSSVYPFMEGDTMIGVELFFRKQSTDTAEMQKPVLSLQPRNGAKKRTFDQLRLSILLTLTRKHLTINQISQQCGINWKTVESHLTYLLGKCYVKEIFSSEYVRIFDITSDGRAFLHSVIPKLDELNKDDSNEQNNEKIEEGWLK